MRRKSERKGDSGGFGDLYVLSRVFASRVLARIFDEDRSVDGIAPKVKRTTTSRSILILYRVDTSP